MTPLSDTATDSPANKAGGQVRVTVSIDTEEDNWGSYATEGMTASNITELQPLQDLFDRFGVRPTYLVNRAPLVDHAAIETLGRLTEREGVEIGGHCHPWNTPPISAEGEAHSWMNLMSKEDNRAKVAEVTRRLRSELGVRPRTFRAGRWGFGPTVAQAIAAEGYRIDSSITPFIDWREYGGPDFTRAHHLPYRFHPEQPFDPDPDGTLIELPTVVGFFGMKNQRFAGDTRSALARSLLGPLHVVGALDHIGVLRYRWPSPEKSTGEELIRVADACVAGGQKRIDLTFHSCTLVAGLTPWVPDEHERLRFLGKIERFFEHCVGQGFDFCTHSEVAQSIFPDMVDL